MFLHMSVILFTGGRGHVWRGGCVCVCGRWGHAWLGAHAWQGGGGMCCRGACMVRRWGVHGRGHVWQGRGVCMVGGMCGRGVHGGGGGMRAGETATEAGGTHPTGMHSCCR